MQNGRESRAPGEELPLVLEPLSEVPRTGSFEFLEEVAEVKLAGKLQLICNLFD